LSELAKVSGVHPGRSNGNPQVIEMLEYWVEEARKGEIHHAALAAVKLNDQVAYDYAGVKGLEDRTQIALKTLTQELEMLRQARLIGPRNMNLGASYIEYHLTGTPICWDFLIWLVDAEMTRRRLKAPPPLRVAFTREDELDKVGRDFFENVFRPLLPLIGAVEDPDAIGGRHKPMYVPYDIVLASRAGEEVPRIGAPDTARETMAGWLHDVEPVTITLREAPHWTHRNSNLEAWLKFAGDLERSGENVVFIRDTYRATEPLEGFATCPMAAWNVGLRMALYEKAKYNLFVSNGPAGLALFGDRPYLYFNNARKDKNYAPNNPEWWMKSQGIKEGESWPWALPSQKLIWKQDSYENLCEEWEARDTVRTDAFEVPRSVVDVITPPEDFGSPSDLASTRVHVFDRSFDIFGYRNEGWFNVFAQTGKYTGFNLESLKPYIKQDSVCLDVGANMGIMTLALAQLAPKGLVLAFEASEANYTGLIRTIDASGLDNIILYNWLVGKESTRGSFVEDPAWRSSGHFRPDPAGDRMMASIDSLDLPRVDFIKIDVEGAELDVLEGASNTIRRCRPTVMVEFNCFALIHYRELMPRQVLRRILDTFPKVCYFDKGTGVAVPLLDPEKFLHANMFTNGFVDDLLCTWE
jgi:FkbM family methyltransferase